MTALPTALPDRRLRLAHPADLSTVKAIVDEAFLALYRGVHHPRPRPTTLDFAPLIANGLVWLVEALSPTGAEPVGILLLALHADHLQVDVLAIKPSQQNRGYGAMAIRFAESEAIARGFSEVRLYTNPKFDRNLAFYRALGFVETGRRPHPLRPGEEHADFLKRLTVPSGGSGPETALDPRAPRAT